MPGPNAWQKNRDSLAGRIIAEAFLKIEAGISSNPQSSLQPNNPEPTGAIHAPKDPVSQLIGYPQGPIYAPRGVLPFNENELAINELEMNDLDIKLESLQPQGGFSGVDLESKELTIEPLDCPELEMELDDSELGVESFKGSELRIDVEIDELPSLDAEAGINGAFDTNNMTSKQPRASTYLNEWDIELSAGDSEEDENDAEADILMGIILLEYLRETEDMRGPYGQIPTSKDWFAVSMMWKGDMFRGVYRVTPRTFNRLATLLGHNQIFQSTGRKPQRPVAEQLACFLIRFGNHGSKASDSRVKMSIGVGTVFHYCRRVVRALREIGLQCLAWPNEERKEEIKRAMEDISHIPGCIGAGDGTLIRLTHKPRVEGNEYYSYKGFVAVNIFCVVDHQKRFIAYEGGWAGSKNDRTTFRESYLWEHRGAMIGRNEQILVDKGFFSNPYVCRPYSLRELHNVNPETKRKRKAFNKNVSRGRVTVENAFALLKRRFPAANYLGTSVNIQTSHRILEALLVLHNLCIDYGDQALDRYGDDTQDYLDDEETLARVLYNFPGHIVPGVELEEGGWDGFENSRWLLTKGNERREQLRRQSQVHAYQVDRQ